MKRNEKIVVLGLGSNIGNRKKYLEQACLDLGKVKGVKLKRVSSLYETSPVGGPPQKYFINAVLQIRTTLPLPSLWKQICLIEKKWGRSRKITWGPRTLDIDILAYGREKRRSKNLIIPHPRYHLRRFVLLPWSEISPCFVHPIYKRTNLTFLRQLTVSDQRVTMRTPWKKFQSQLFTKRKNPKHL